jgi:hypothetical protein
MLTNIKEAIERYITEQSTAVEVLEVLVFLEQEGEE